MEGYMEKRSMFRDRRRYFHVGAATLCYSDAPNAKIKGMIHLHQVTSVLFEDPYRRITLRGSAIDSLKPKKDVYVLIAPTHAEYIRWRGTIRRLRAVSAASAISSTTSFSRLVTGFRACIRASVEASIIDLSEYSDADFDVLQRRHAQHNERLQKQREQVRRRASSLLEDSHGDAQRPPMKLSQLFELERGGTGSMDGSTHDLSLGAGMGGDSSLLHPDTMIEELLPQSSPANEPLLIGRPALPRRPMHLPRTSNPLPQATPPLSARDAVGASLHRDPAGHLGGVVGGILMIPDAPPRPGSTIDAMDIARRKAAADAFAGPAWRYLDVLKHAGGIMSSVQYVASERDLREFWEMYATTDAGYITENEHRNLLQHLVEEVRATMPAVLNDVVLTVLKAYGLSEGDQTAQAVVASCSSSIQQIVDRFYESLQGEVDSIAADMWAALDTRGAGRVSRSAFMGTYQCRPIVPTSALIDVTLDEVGSQIQRHMLQSATAHIKIADNGAPVLPVARRGECGLANLGNTCYLNSALQCLAHTPMLRQHLLLGKQRDLDSTASTPLCDALAALFRSMYEGQVAPATLTAVRAAINHRTSDFFAGIAQHDAQELLMAILDGMHDEMNGASKSIQWSALPDQPLRPDAELAMEWWAAHVRRNRSPIVDWFHGQMKCVTTCRECGGVSLCFDPFSFLTVPIPSPEAAETGEAVAASGTGAAKLGASTSSRASSSSSSGAVSSDDGLESDDELTGASSSKSGGLAVGNWLTVPAEDSPPRIIRKAAKTTKRAAAGRHRSGSATQATAAVRPAFTLDEPSWLFEELVPASSSAAAAPTPIAAAASVDLERCVATHFTEEHLSGADAVYCGRCKKHCKGSRSTSLWRAPYYLMIGLKRFKHDKTGQVLSKNTTPVSIPDRLHLERFIDSSSDGGPFVAGHVSPSALHSGVPSPLYATTGHAAASDTASAPVTPKAATAQSGFKSGGAAESGAEYELYGVIRHSGWISGGHYTAVCAASPQRWVMFNDGMVVPMDHRGVVDDGAYVLMYKLRRTAMPPSSSAVDHQQS